MTTDLEDSKADKFKELVYTDVIVKLFFQRFPLDLKISRMYIQQL